MRISILLIIFISFVLNGCVVNRIKQRLYYNNHTSKKIVSSSKINQYEVQDNFEQKVYQPTPATTISQSYTKLKKTTKRKRVVKKRQITQAKKNRYKKTTKMKRAHKKKRAKVKKIVSEPYSIKRDESDPELLGPQTTLDSNPLTSKKI